MNTIVVLLLTVITVPNSPYSLCGRKATLNHGVILFYLPSNLFKLNTSPAPPLQCFLNTKSEMMIFEQVGTSL